MTLWHHLIPFLLVPAGLLPFTASWRRDARFWLSFGLAALAATVWTAVQFATSWSTGFAPALWLVVASSLVLFVILSLVVPEFWRLGAILGPWLLTLSVVALAWNQAEPAGRLPQAAATGWILAHITLTVATYVVLTLAAATSLAVMIQERALRRRHASRLASSLPSLADCERLEHRLLGAGAVILAAGIATGVVLTRSLEGSFFVLDHKTVFTLAAFAVIASLLLAHRVRGTRGRRSARLVLVGYLLVTLAWPGVKFVTDVLIG